MAESKLYRARVQMVEAMEQGLPWDEAAKQVELQISQSTAYRLRQRMRQGGSWRCRKAGMDTQSNSEARSDSGWKRRADRLLTRRATRSRRS